MVDSTVFSNCLVLSFPIFSSAQLLRELIQIRIRQTLNFFVQNVLLFAIFKVDFERMFKSFVLRNVSDIPKNMCAYNLQSSVQNVK